jgi:diguanylate cyclase (GGDEF)-like protein
VTVTISIGYALRGKQHDSLEEVLKSADQQLYEAKKKGRNRVEPAATG